MAAEHGDRDAYLATLRRLQPLRRAGRLGRARATARRSTRQRALAILREDLAYLEALPAPDAPLPLARRDRAQKQIHAENLERVGLR